MTDPTDAVDAPDDHLTAEGIFDELVVEALEHADGGDGGAPERKAGRTAKIITVVKVQDFSQQDFVERDLMLIKVSTENGRRGEIRELVDIFRGRIVDVGASHVMIEISGRESKIEAFIERMREFGILEMVRTGRIAMLRDRTITDEIGAEESSESVSAK